MPPVTFNPSSSFEISNFLTRLPYRLVRADLSARTKKGNERSARVLLRAGFAPEPSIDGDSGHNRFMLKWVMNGPK